MTFSSRRGANPGLTNPSSTSFSSVQSLSRVWLFATSWTTACQASLSITNSGVHPNPCPLSQWCHPTISSSFVPFSSCPQSFPASGFFQWVNSSHQVVKVLRAGGEGDDRWWDGWMASLTQWTWVWVDSRNWWWIGRPGILWFMGSQRAGHNWETELNWITKRMQNI